MFAVNFMTGLFVSAVLVGIVSILAGELLQFGKENDLVEL